MLDTVRFFRYNIDTNYIYKAVRVVSDKELVTMLLDMYAVLELIIHSENVKEEAEYQQGLIKTKLESMGVTTMSRLDRKETVKL